MYALAQFPSQGDLIKFAYDALGIIPSKSEQILDLKVENKSLQKSLQRLAKEKDSSNYLENSTIHVQALNCAVSDLFPSYQFHNSVLDTLKEFFQCYLTTVLQNHTYLDKEKSFEFIIFTVLLPRLPVSILKHKESYAVFFQKIHAPQNFYWFLGSEDQTPLSYIMQWIYDSENLSRENFHNLSPNQLKYREDNQDDKDIWNTQNWLRNKSIPAFNDLKSVFDRAFKSHAIPTNRQESYLFFLLLARFCTYCLQEIQSNYSADFLNQVTKQLKAYLNAIYKDFNQYKQTFESNKVLIKGVIFSIESQLSISNSYPYKNESSTNILAERSKNTLNNFINDLFNQKVTLAKYLEETSDITFSKYKEKIDKGYIFNFAKISNLNFFKREFNNTYESNIENYHNGYFDVLNQKIEFENWLEQYKACQNDIIYPWLEQWIRGVISFKQNQYQEALEFMDNAFETVRYSAGKHQERFLEDYLLMSLANSKGYKSFKKSYKWGAFMNHFGGLKKLFNLTNDEDIKKLYQDKKEIFHAFEKMKNNMDMKTLSKLVFHWQYES